MEIVQEYIDAKVDIVAPLQNQGIDSIANMEIRQKLLVSPDRLQPESKQTCRFFACGIPCLHLLREKDICANKKDLCVAEKLQLHRNDIN